MYIEHSGRTSGGYIYRTEVCPEKYQSYLRALLLKHPPTTKTHKTHNTPIPPSFYPTIPLPSIHPHTLLKPLGKVLRPARAETLY